MKEKQVFHEVQKNYGSIALGGNSCCGSSELVELNQPVMSLGCYSDLIERAEIQPGSTVLDLGCGPGRDVIVASRKVGDTGRVIGLDMTEEMIDLARRNTSELKNVEIIEGNLQRIPLEDNSVDIIISNCVINLAPNKQKAFAEAYRVLKPGGKMVESDVALERELPIKEMNNPQVYCGCIGGALPQKEYLRIMESVGFKNLASEILHSSSYHIEGKDYPYNSVLFIGYKE